jgi:hypothetical protein
MWHGEIYPGLGRTWFGIWSTYYGLDRGGFLFYDLRLDHLFYDFSGKDEAGADIQVFLIPMIVL